MNFSHKCCCWKTPKMVRYENVKWQKPFPYYPFSRSFSFIHTHRKYRLHGIYWRYRLPFMLRSWCKTWRTTTQQQKHVKSFKRLLFSTRISSIHLNTVMWNRRKKEIFVHIFSVQGSQCSIHFIHMDYSLFELASQTQ